MPPAEGRLHYIIRHIFNSTFQAPNEVDFFGQWSVPTGPHPHRLRALVANNQLFSVFPY